MTPELFWLAATVLLTALLWLPYVLERMVAWGLAGTLGNPQDQDKPQSAWAVRAIAAHRNAVENLILFAPLAVIVAVAGLSSPTTALLAQAYFWARLAHFVVYTAGIPVARTLAFTAGWVVQVWLALIIIGWL